MPTVKELKEEAKSKGIKGFSTMKKAELEKALGGGAKKEGKSTPDIKAPKWTERVPSHVFVIKDTKNNSIRPNFVDIDKAYEGMIDPEKYDTNFVDLELGNVSYLKKTIKKNSERPEAEGSFQEKMDVREKKRGMEKMIKDIQGGRFKFEKKNVEKTKTGIKINGRKLNQNDWRNEHYDRADGEVRDTQMMGLYFVRPVDLTK